MEITDMLKNLLFLNFRPVHHLPKEPSAFAAGTAPEIRTGELFHAERLYHEHARFSISLFEKIKYIFTVVSRSPASPGNKKSGALLRNEFVCFAFSNFIMLLHECRP
jgi:hypothetical protein